MHSIETHQVENTHFFRSTALFLLAIICSFALLQQPAAAVGSGDAAGSNGRYVCPIGRTVGIKLFSEGVLVIGLSDIKTEDGSSSPARACGLREGDIITHINGEEVNSIEEVQAQLQALSGDSMRLRILRGEAQSQLEAQAAQCTTDGIYKLGAWIRDSMAGIGTVTFYDPASNIFGTLGHGINDMDTAMLMPLESGAIMPSSVADVRRGMSGEPGELHGVFEVENDLGQLYANTPGGVFGLLSDVQFFAGYPLVAIADAAEVQIGFATILSNISGEAVEKFSVEITKVITNSSDTRDLVLEVTDPRLLSETGGIVQGMSGSPILQNGKLVGAVTHVMVNDPTRGYGIFAARMFTMAEEALAG